tara:strand:- start:841 stop:2604 length:1764 start_codon:yes stop_codon:yes gene_type:complete
MNPIKLSKFFFEKKLIFSIFLLIPLLLVSSGLEVIGISIVPILIGLVINPKEIFRIINDLNFEIINPVKDILNSSNPNDIIGYIAISFFLIFFIKNLILLSIIYFENFISYKMKEALITKLALKYFFAPYNFHINTNSSFLINNIIQETKVTAEYFRNLIVISREILLVTSILITLFVIYPFVTLISLIFLSLVSLVFYIFSKNYLYKLNKIGFYLRRNFLNNIKQGFGSIKSTLILQRENSLLDQINKMARSYEKIQFKVGFYTKLPRIYFELIFIFAVCFLIFLFSSYNNSFQNIFPILATLAVAMIRIIPSFNNLNGSLILLKSLKISANHIYKELFKLKNVKKINETKKIKDKKSNLKKDIYGDIEFKKINFKYPSSKKYIFRNLNLKLKKGQIIGVIGESGSGKTTLIDLILGLLKPTSGIITSNNINIDLYKYEWRKKLGYVPQDIYLIDESIKKNILIGLKKSEINIKRLNRSLEQSRVNKFLNKLDKKLSTNVGEMGVKISGGQKQRIGIARALYKDPKVIIFDEATSSLDRENEKKIIKDIKSLSRNKIVIFVTHKKENLKFADKILRVSENKVIQIK